MHRVDEGSSVVEAVIVVPVLMFLLMVCVQVCLWMHAVQVTQVAASEGDRVARAFGGGPSAGVATAQEVLKGPGSDVTGSTVAVSVLPGDSEWLQVSGRAISIVPGLGFSVSASAVGPIQQFRSEALEFGNSEAHRGSNLSVSARLEAHWDPRVPRPEGYRVTTR